MSPAWTLVLLWVFTSGFIGFILMGIDKATAQDREWRIPEKSLFTLALIGGAFGILLGSGFFHHKTLKASFEGVVLISAAIWAVILAGLTRLLGFPF
jgi:uncharacterized membrane protein YsdA (DUF1294 family)